MTNRTLRSRFSAHLAVPGLLLLTACSPGDVGKTTTADSAQAAPIVTVTPVNRGTHGMSQRIRWMLAPDSSAMIVVSDPAGAEAEPVPNGFFFGSESRNFQLQMDSVWDVAVSPGWSAIAFGRAYTIRGSEQDTAAPASAWQDLARQMGIDSATVRTSSFASSGMSYARAAGQPGIIRIPADARAAGAADSARPRMFPVPRGWRVRWTEDESAIGLGNNPPRAQDDEISATWAALDPRTGAFSTTLPATARLVEPRWVQGPAIDASTPMEMTKAPQLFVRRDGRNYTIESARGVITLRESGTADGGIVIGPGIALAATRSGRFIAALAPAARSGEYRHAVEAVVYSVSR